MKHLATAGILVAAAINLAPALGAFSPERMAAAYGVVLDDPDLEILMRHRAVLFGIVGSLLVLAAFHEPARRIGYLVGFASMLSFLAVAGWVGDYSDSIRRIAIVDLVGIAALAVAAATDWHRNRA